MAGTILLSVSLIILLCVISERLSDKLGVPALIFFMFVGMLCGSDGIFRYEYDDFALAELICSIGLVFIMFDGGFNTKWKTAKKTIGKAVSLSTFGVLLTALVTTVCCHLFMKLSLQESFLIASVLASTDAASVFAILKANNLDLKDNTSPILEVESGSNDPMAYLLTITAIGIMKTGETGNLLLTIFVQLAVGFLMGLLFARLARYILRKRNIVIEGLDTIFVLSIAMLCYALTDKLQGNAYLSVYMLGLYMGNSKIKAKRSIIAFSNELTSLLQILIFFIIGLLSSPRSFPFSLGAALMVTFILTFISRPLMTIILLMPQKCSLRQCLLISWAGLRGASSIVFAIMAVSSGIDLSIDLFHVVFLVSLFSIAIQGALLPKVSVMLKMVDEHPDISKTFNDYEEDVDFQLAKFHIHDDDRWAGQMIKDIDFPFGSQAVMIKRGGRTLAARGSRVVEAGDDVILNVPHYHPNKNETVHEIVIDRDHPWAEKTVRDIHVPEDQLIIMIIRGVDRIIPSGHTVIQANDVLLMFKGEHIEYE